MFSKLEDHFEHIKEDFEESKKFLVDLELNCENTKKELAEYRNMTRDMTLVSDGLVSGGDVDQWFHELLVPHLLDVSGLVRFCDGLQHTCIGLHCHRHAGSLNAQ